MYEWVEMRVELRNVFPQKLVEQYASAFRLLEDAEAKARLLEQFLLETTDLTQTHIDYVDIAANEIVDRNGLVQLNELIQKSCTTRRTFERNFFNKVGLSPKFFSRIRRIAYICNLIAGKKEVFWPKIYSENAFYDHAHFIRDFEEFLGRSPGQYIKENNELVHFVEKPSVSALTP
jgi:AraC-like DNA-binding protein